jgi:ribosomal protein S18 acetylase RimI-like enzyme
VVGELACVRGLTDRELDAIGELERQVVAVDGGRLKLAWGHLRSRGGEQVEDLLWWEGERLLGFLGLYSFATPIELTGMVAPDARRRGIASALLDAALPLCRARDQERALLVVPRSSAGGRALAAARGGALDHSEHALVLVGSPVGSERAAGVSLRPANRHDAPFVRGLLEVGFGLGAAEASDIVHSSHGRTWLVEHEGDRVGTLAVSRHDGDAGIFGFVIDPPRRGGGLGREALRQMCVRLREDGAQRIELEVEVENERALALYTTIGFTPVITEDYYSVPVR